MKKKSLQQNLNKIIEDLNNLIDQSSSTLYNIKQDKKENKKEDKKEVNLAKHEKHEKILESNTYSYILKLFIVKEKVLASTKFQLNIYMQQFEALNHKVNEKLSSKR